MKRAARALLVMAIAAMGSVAPGNPRQPETAAEAARRWIHPKAVTAVYYDFDVDTEGLPRHMYQPPPRDIVVTYRDLDTGRLVTEHVGPTWGRIFRNPKFTRGRIEAVAHGGGYMWCVFEVNHADESGWIVSEFGRRRCRVKRRF